MLIRIVYIFLFQEFNECPDLTLKSIHTRSLYISRHTLDLFHILQKQPREEFYKVYPLKQPNLKSYLSSIYFDTSLEGSIKENIDELIYEAIETIRGKKHKIPNDFSICHYLNVKIRISLNAASDTY